MAAQEVRLDEDGFVIEEEEVDGLVVEEVGVGEAKEEIHLDEDGYVIDAAEVAAKAAKEAEAAARIEAAKQAAEQAAAEKVAADAADAALLDDDAKADVLEKLVAVSAQWKGDDFWKSLANPVDRALKALDEGRVRYAYETLDVLMLHLPGGSVGPLKSLPAEGLHSEQRRDVRHCRDVLLKALTPAKQLPPPQDDPILFVQHEWDSEFTLKIKVPWSTKSSDATVTFEERRLRVEVVGHARRPIIDGTLFEKIKADDSAWFLEGDGERRVLVVHLEKVYPRKVWPTLYKALGPPEAGSIESGDDFWSRHDREHEAHHRKMGTWKD